MIVKGLPALVARARRKLMWAQVTISATTDAATDAAIGVVKKTAGGSRLWVWQRLRLAGWQSMMVAAGAVDTMGMTVRQFICIGVTHQ